MGKKGQALRFAAGTPDAPLSSVWRLLTSGNEIYIGSSKESMGILKISLHSSGVWTLAGTTQSGMQQHGNRRLQRWSEPPEHAPGAKRGPSIYIPSVSADILMDRDSQFIPRQPVSEAKPILWYPAPPQNFAVEFSVYILKAGLRSSFESEYTDVGERGLKNGSRVQVLARHREMPADFQKWVEDYVATSHADLDVLPDSWHGSLLNFYTSADDMAIPIAIDLPMPFRLNPRSPDSVPNH